MTILGIDIAEIRRQCIADKPKCPVSIPIKQNYGTLEPCIEGGRQILADEKAFSFFRQLYLRRRQSL